MALGKSAGKWRRTEVLLFAAPLLVLACTFGWFFVSKALLPPPPPMILKGHSSQTFDCAFAADSKTLVTASADGTLKIWDTGTGMLRRTLRGHRGEVKSAAVSPDGRYVLSGGWFPNPTNANFVGGGELKLWDMATGAVLWTQTLSDWHDVIYSVAFAPDGKRCAAGMSEGAIKICEVKTGKVLRTLPGGTGIYSLAFAPRGEWLASNDKLWDLATGHSLRKVGWQDETIAFSPDGKVFAVGRRSGTIDLQDTRTGKLMRTLTPVERTPSGAAEAPEVAFTADGKLLAYMRNVYGSVTVWGLATGAVQRHIVGNSPGMPSEGKFSPDGKMVAILDGWNVMLWRFIR